MPTSLREPSLAVSAQRRFSLAARLARGAFWSLAGSLVARGAGLLTAIMVGRILGKDGFGELGLVQSTVGMFGTFAGFGMGLTANKQTKPCLSRDRFDKSSSASGACRPLSGVWMRRLRLRELNCSSFP